MIFLGGGVLIDLSNLFYLASNYKLLIEMSDTIGSEIKLFIRIP